MNRALRFVRGHFRRLETKSRWTYFWRTWLEAVVLAAAAATVTQALFPAAPRADLAGLGMVELCLLVLGVGPLVETVAFQCLPAEFAAAAGVRRWLRILLSVVPFALMHHFAGVPTVVAAGFIGGFYFAFTYERWRQESLFAGIAMTFLLHSSFNLVNTIALLVGR